MNPLKAGDIAPKFSLPDQDGEQVNLTDFQGQRVLVYFYPKAMTPGCTVQACGLRDNMDELKKAGVEVNTEGKSVLGRHKDFSICLKFIPEEEIFIPVS